MVKLLAACWLVGCAFFIIGGETTWFVLGVPAFLFLALL